MVDLDLIGVDGEPPSPQSTGDAQGVVGRFLGFEGRRAEGERRRGIGLDQSVENAGLVVGVGIGSRHETGRMEAIADRGPDSE